MNLKPVKYYVIFLVGLLAFYTYSLVTGMVFFPDKAEKNTDFNSKKGHSGHINRFYHK